MGPQSIPLCTSISNVAVMNSREPFAVRKQRVSINNEGINGWILTRNPCRGNGEGKGGEHGQFSPCKGACQICIT